MITMLKITNNTSTDIDDNLGDPLVAANRFSYFSLDSDSIRTNSENVIQGARVMGAAAGSGFIYLQEIDATSDVVIEFGNLSRAGVFYTILSSES